MKPTNRSTKSFAWDGMEFPVPESWDIANYTMRRGIGSLSFEDATDLRLEVDWTHAAGRQDIAKVQKQHARLAERLHEIALTVEAINDISEFWVVFLYTLPESDRLVTALHVGEQFPLFVFARLHARKCSRREILRDARALIQGFRYRDRGTVAWRFFDVSWRIPRDFRLTETSLLAGRKMMVFEHRLRRLFLWRLSLIDRLMRERSATEVAAEFLNKSKAFPGVRFHAAGADTLRVRRYRWHPLGHYDEIGRGCFRYWTKVDHSVADNAMTMAVFNYRRAADLNWLKGTL